MPGFADIKSDLLERARKERKGINIFKKVFTFIVQLILTKTLI